jgi:sortase A
MQENRWNRPAGTSQTSRLHAVLRGLEYGCWIAGALNVGVFVVSWLSILSFQASQAKRFEGARETHLQTARAIIPLRPGEPFGRVTIPRIGLSAMVLEGDDPSTLARAVGHIPGTAAPESAGNVALAGHRDTLFRGLGRVRLKDLIELETAQGKYEYEVLRVAVVDPDQIEVLESSNQSELTLVTCYPFHYVGAAPQRLVVRSSRVAAH